MRAVGNRLPTRAPQTRHAFGKDVAGRIGGHSLHLAPCTLHPSASTLHLCTIRQHSSTMHDCTLHVVHVRGYRSTSNSYKPGVTNSRPVGPKDKLSGANTPAPRNCTMRILSPWGSKT